VVLVLYFCILGICNLYIVPPFAGLVLPVKDRSHIYWSILVIGIRLGVEKNQLCVCAAQEGESVSLPFKILGAKYLI
jgi:hypothetical protein